MAMPAPALTDDPPPEAHRGRPIRALASLAAPPAAWIAQLVVSYSVASHLCRPGDAPRAGAGWAGESMFLITVQLGCLLVAVAAGLVALADWRRPGGDTAGQARERVVGRVRFLALCGMIAAVTFALAIAFGLAAPFTVPSCWRFAP